MEACSERLVFPFENKVWKRQESAGVLGIFGTLNARFGAGRVIVGQIAGAVECAGIVYERDDRFRLYADEVLFFQSASDELASFAMIVVHGVNQGQRDVPFFQVAENGLDKLFG